MEPDATADVIDFGKIPTYLELAWEAHFIYARTPEGRVRRHDGKTPYFVHPVLAAMAIMHEPKLSLESRWLGFQVLTLHDVLEDTTLEFPEWVPDEVRELVGLMSYDTSQAEMEEVWQRSELVRLFKLFDKVSNLLDGVWMDERPPEYRQRFEEYVLNLANDVDDNFGLLNICRIARALCYPD